MLQNGSPTSPALRAGSSTMSPQKLSEITLPDANLSCTPHSFKNVHILHRDPLVVYIEGFLSSAETSELVSSSTPLFTPSTVWTSGEERLDTAIRHSSKAPVPRSQTAQCVESRARAFQGWRPFVFIEKLWAQRYGPGGHYTYHFDWASASRSQGRISSFMVWLQDECTGGGTHFPRIQKPRGEEWCRFVECGAAEEEEREGVVFKPVKGNAVYWENFRPDGTGFEESWHAGLPVLSGEKIGLNIWSWFQDGYVPEGEQAQGAELD
ncbi:hypothetical protein E8E13_001239 [Curvularia kusanoi]|uniref:Prolyl 4-hydroxylase alpha subunit domain-containing protein n=1 Tax=Curvularia kusanoi TaxID=90978 RepID=A0A9P4T4N0_CURKU|nr:hypothetical protein E8E13_001239 [Curvularia kusanoi]